MLEDTRDCELQAARYKMSDSAERRLGRRGAMCASSGSWAWREDDGEEEQNSLMNRHAWVAQ